MNHHIDYKQVIETSSLRATDTDGSEFTVENAVIIPVVIPGEDVPELLAQYDPSSGTSPLVAVARPLARVILDALLRKSQE